MMIPFAYTFENQKGKQVFLFCFVFRYADTRKWLWLLYSILFALFLEKGLTRTNSCQVFFFHFLFPWNCLIQRLGPVGSVCMLMAHALSFHYSLLSISLLLACVEERERETGKDFFLCFFPEPSGWFYARTAPNFLPDRPSTISFRSGSMRRERRTVSTPVYPPFNPNFRRVSHQLGPKNKKEKNFYFSSFCKGPKKKSKKTPDGLIALTTRNGFRRKPRDEGFTQSRPAATPFFSCVYIFFSISSLTA